MAYLCAKYYTRKRAHTIVIFTFVLAEMVDVAVNCEVGRVTETLLIA